MATWIWLNIPAMAVAFALMVGIPTRMVLKNARKEQAPVLVPTTDIQHERVRELIAA
jgi:hypothetical protein